MFCMQPKSIMKKQGMESLVSLTQDSEQLCHLFVLCSRPFGMCKSTAIDKNNLFFVHILNFKP